ncbi:MAG: YIP1 family protein [Gemmatimonadales bacterium]
MSAENYLSRAGYAEVPLPICPHCGFESGRGTVECPLCGTRLSEAAVGHHEHGPAGRVAWEDSSEAFPANLFLTWRDSLFRPAAFFRRLAWESSLARPLLYYLLVSIASAFFALLWRSTDAPLLPAAFGPEAPLAPLVQFFFEPFAALIGLGVGALVLQLFAIILAPARRDLRATARVFCYSAGPAVFSAVPLLGPAVGAVWSLVLLVMGLREAHRTSPGRAAAIVLIPAVGLVMVLAALLVFLVLAGLATGELLEW